MHGLDALAHTLEQIADGTAASDAGARLQQLGPLVRRRGACSHPDGTARFVTSATEVFAEEFADHARHGVCESCARRPALPLPAYAHAAGAA